MTTQHIWITFGFMFAGLSLIHCKQSTKSIKKPDNYAKAKKVNGVRLGIAEFISYFQDYVDDLNKQTKRANKLAALGYLVASLTSFYSYYLSLGN